MRDELTPEECRATMSSNILNAYIIELPVLSELSIRGRMHLLRNENLRATIAATQQARERMAELVAAGNLHAFNLRSRYPELIQRGVSFFAPAIFPHPVTEVCCRQVPHAAAA